jgi:fumarate reductase subunit C
MKEAIIFTFKSSVVIVAWYLVMLSVLWVFDLLVGSSSLPEFLQFLLGGAILLLVSSVTVPVALCTADTWTTEQQR